MAQTLQTEYPAGFLQETEVPIVVTEATIHGCPIGAVTAVDLTATDVGEGTTVWALDARGRPHLGRLQHVSRKRMLTSDNEAYPPSTVVRILGVVRRYIFWSMVEVR